MATFVDICTEEEQVIALSQYVEVLRQKREGDNYINNGTQLEAQYVQLLHQGKLATIISNLIDRHDTIFSDQNDKEIEACMNVISASIKKVEPNLAASLIQKLREAVVSNVTDRPILRLRILTNIYYAFDRSSSSRYDIFVAMVSFAAESGNAELVIPKFKQIDQWVVEWGTNIDQTRKLYKLARKVLASSNRSLQAHELITKYLQTFNADIKEGKEVPEEVVVTAAEAAREAILSEEIYQCDHLFSLEAVKILENHPQFSVLYQLLQIFAQEKLDSYQTFQERHPGFIQNFGLSEEHCLRKIRLLSLVSLGAENGEIPYSLIAQTLQISEGDVENWVIDAVSSRLIEAKMNQLKQTVHVSFYVQRIFTITQWKQLSAKLNKWRGGVRHLLQTVQQQNRGGRGPLQATQSSLTVV